MARVASRWHPANLHKITVLQTGGLEGVAFSPDRSKLYTSQCACGFDQWHGPSPLSEQSATGGSTSAIFTDPSNAILQIIGSLGGNSQAKVIANFTSTITTTGTDQISLYAVGWTTM